MFNLYALIKLGCFKFGCVNHFLVCHNFSKYCMQCWPCWQKHEWLAQSKQKIPIFFKTKITPCDVSIASIIICPVEWQGGQQIANDWRPKIQVSRVV